MANKINPFYYSGVQMEIFTNALFGNVRSTEINGELWFVGSDVASCLGYANPWKAIQDHVDIEDKANLTIREVSSIQNRNMIIINESGLYSLILRSNLPSANQFKHWVTHEVLPTMRKIGFSNSMYILQQALIEKERMIEVLKHEKEGYKQQVHDLQLHNDILEQGSIFSLNKFLSGEKK